MNRTLSRGRGRVCLVLDNPLRDIDGIVLLAYELARRGITSYIVPMHLQGFDVTGLQPDVLLANYVRKNNWDLLKTYRERGIRVAVLDTEGTGDWWADYARQLAGQAADGYVDAYYCWSETTRAHLLDAGALQEKKIRVVGCPRYDFTAPMLRRCLEAPTEAPGYVLVNTNFPLANPRFASGTEEEKRTWVYVGFDPDYVERYAVVTRKAYEGVKQAVRELATRLPDIRFVLRPHPFERTDAYAGLTDLPNVVVRQEGTSLMWLNQAMALLHLNCSTALEASFLGVDALSFEWLNDPLLLVRDAHSASRPAPDVETLYLWLKSIASGQALEAVPERQHLVAEIVRRNYDRLDGQAAVRVAEDLRQLREAPLFPCATCRIGVRQRVVSLFRRVAGFRVAYGAKYLTANGRRLARLRADKVPTVEAVQRKLAQIAAGLGCPENVPEASVAPRGDYALPRLASGQVVRVN
jgi:surface carbohydrate biosynthesis protein